MTRQRSVRRKRLLHGIRSGLCYWCNREFGAHELTLDHLIPKAVGGTYEQANIVLACRSCNTDRAKTWQTRLAQAASLPPAELDERWKEFADVFELLAIAVRTVEARRAELETN